MSEPYQPALPGLAHPNAGRRRRPHKRKGESCESYLVRYETWFIATFGRHKTPAERAADIRRHMAWRERVQRSTEVHCYLMIDQVKRTPKTGAVFFWFGGEIGRPGTQSQYVNQAGLTVLSQTGYGLTRHSAKRGKNRVSFGECGQP